jgi:hypothetical protein
MITALIRHRQKPPRNGSFTNNHLPWGARLAKTPRRLGRFRLRPARILSQFCILHTYLCFGLGYVQAAGASPLRAGRGQALSKSIASSPWASASSARVGWDERSESQHPTGHKNVGFRKLNPTYIQPAILYSISRPSFSPPLPLWAWGGVLLLVINDTCQSRTAAVL